MSNTYYVETDDKRFWLLDPMHGYNDNILYM